MELSEIIRQRIHEQGPISFRDFMEMCLYYPGAGYYTSPGERIGKQGDFYTSANLGEWLGATLARQLVQMWELSGRGEFTVVEYGAGTGLLCRDILQALERNKEFFSRLRYCIIEKSPAMRSRQKLLLGDGPCWHESIETLAPFTGCVLSNELVDNFSVHRVVMLDELMEIYVDYDSAFRERLEPASAAVRQYFDELGVTLPRGFRTEVNLEAVSWISEIAESLAKGYVITIDYGYSSTELYRSRRSGGTLLCYHKHNINDQAFLHIGQQDITCHVNFSALAHWGEKQGLGITGFTTQAGFMLGLGLEDLLQQSIRSSDLGGMRQYAFLKHSFLLDIGQKFKVLIQQKGLPPSLLLGLSTGTLPL